ncbi:MAG TPA: LysR substrate-binding domain-containing protein [Caulobacteraceae bacterium]|nr:LysR substrate-binding domain-containing protein [Caulobacteraceae bacterium]
MPDRGPPFAALRALEAACRLKSYSAAGEELGVTHSAISQSMRRLEQAYAQKLFHRQGLGMEPTPAAVALSIAYRQAARIVADAAEALRGQDVQPALVLSTVPSVARLWLGPRLKRLRESLPDIAVEVRTSRELANLETDGVDVAMRLGVGEWPRLKVEPLFDETLFPVCSPEFLARHGPMDDAAIARAPLILEDTDLWPAWFESAGVTRPPQARGLAFDDAAMVIEAAAAGLGVALVRPLHAEEALEARRLVRISATEVKTRLRCCLVWREDNPRVAAIRRFADWILAEFGRGGLLQAA